MDLRRVLSRMHSQCCRPVARLSKLWGGLPRLEHLRERWVVVPPVLPDQQPTRNLARRLSRAFAARGHERPTDELEDRVTEDRMLSYQEALAQYHLHPSPSSTVAATWTVE